LMKEVAAREKAQEQLRQAQKMETIGQLTGGVAHDFNNLLMAVMGNLDLLRKRIPNDPRLHRLIDGALQGAERGASLTQRLLAFARQQDLRAIPVDLRGLINGMIDLLERSLGPRVGLRLDLPEGLPPARVDANQLELAILNLAINARDAMPAGGRVIIQTRNVKASERDKPVELPPGDYVLISVTDTGTGMSPEVLARACEPFFTTKEPGKGSGLGLAQVYGLAQQSGGGLRIASTLGKGTSVAVYLPRSQARPRKSPEESEAASHESLSRRARVLVVDDNEDVRDVILAYLDALGYRTLQAASGHEAIELLAGDDADIDLLMADYAMPGMSGTELARAARAKWPELPVIVITGYAETTGFDDQFDEAMLLRKPFRINELGAAIERAVQHSNAAASSAKIVPLRPRAAS